MFAVSSLLIVAGMFFNGRRIRSFAVKGYIAAFFILLLINSSATLTNMVFPGLLAAKT